MGSSQDHAAKANHNQAFLDTVDIVAFPDWAATIAFYKAVHLIESLADAVHTHHSKNHGDRGSYLRKYQRDIWPHFRALLNFSMLARYEIRRIDPDDIRTKVIGYRLAEIEKLVSKKLAELHT